MINPCRHCGNEPQENVAISCHTIICVPCWNEATGTHYDAAVRNWNSENPPPKPKTITNVDIAPKSDQAIVWAYAQSGNAEQAAAYEAHIFGQTFGQVQDDLLAAMKAQTQTALNALYGLLVKKTADGLPNESIDVLIWVDELWEYAHIGTDGDWYDYQDRYWGSNEVKYWLPLPTFNPESE